MALSTASKTAAEASITFDAGSPVFVFQRGFRSLARTAGQPLGCFDLELDDTNPVGPGEGVATGCTTLNEALAPRSSPVVCGLLVIGGRAVLRVAIVDKTGPVILSDRPFAVTLLRLN